VAGLDQFDSGAGSDLAGHVAVAADYKRCGRRGQSVERDIGHRRGGLANGN
jgi:hypothetical protein